MENETTEKEFKHIENAFEYVKEGIKSGAFIPEEVRKIALVEARQGTVGEEVKTILPSGLEELKGTVQLDETTGEPGWIAKNPGGEEYIIKDSDFHKMYMSVDEKPGVYKKTVPSLAVEIAEDISFTNKYGEEMKIEKGGHLIFFDGARGVLGNRTYGVAGEAWNTYEKTGKSQEEALKLAVELLELDKEMNLGEVKLEELSKVDGSFLSGNKKVEEMNLPKLEPIGVNPELTPEQAAEEDVRKASEEFDKEVSKDLDKDENQKDTVDPKNNNDGRE